MVHTAFDTLSMAQRLERDFDFPPKQAEGTAMLLHEHITGNVASKEDIAALKRDVSALKKDVSALKKDVSALKENISALKENISALEGKMDAQIAELRFEIGRLRNDGIWMKLIGVAIFAAVIAPWLAELGKIAFS